MEIIPITRTIRQTRYYLKPDANINFCLNFSLYLMQLATHKVVSLCSDENV